MRRLLPLSSWVAMAVVMAACGADRTGGPRGEPAAVVGASADRTVAAGRARFEATAPDARTSGAIDLSAPPAVPAPPPPPSAHPELASPGAVVDLVRGALAVESYGGAAVRGVSTFRYEAVINVERAVLETPPGRRAQVEELARRLGAAAFYADLWIDGEGRLRRVQLPLKKTTERPAARSKELPKLVTVDFFDFERS